MCEKDHSKSMHRQVKRHYKKRIGSSLEHLRAHQKEHRQWNRRDFMLMTGLAALGSSIKLAGAPVSAFHPGPLVGALGAADCGDRVLVLIRLKGGNDGLNTVILRDNDEYYNIRPTLAVQEPDLWALSQEYGMPNVMSDLQPLWNDGRMQVIHNVGYPGPNYSHFRSSDIWASASDSNEIVRTGWLGRWLENDYPAFLSAPPAIPPALQIGVQSNLVFKGADANMALSISNPTEFYQIAQTGQLYPTGMLGGEPNEAELEYVRTVANSAFRYSESIQGAYNTGSNEVAYPNHYLGEQLQIVSRLIKGNLGSKVYMVTIGGFDTHAQQNPAHQQLLTAVAGSVKAFFDDLDQSGHSQNVLAMTFSEFGRTIYENGSQGTDHGTGAPMLLFGNDLGSSFHGDPPDLVNVGPYGDPEFSVDFRSVYSSVLNNWLCVPDEVTSFSLGDDFGEIENLVPPSDPPLGSNGRRALLGHRPNDNNGEQINIYYSIQDRGQTKIQLLDKSGHAIRTLLDDFRERGSYTLTFNPSQYLLSPGQYLYRLETGGKVYVRPVRW
jgi:uncharacterized protein (DUF1501 family)